MKDHELPTLALQAIRKSLPIDSWSKFADVIVSDRRKRQPHLVKPEADRSWFGAIESLRQNGIVKLPNRLPAETIADIRRYLDAEPVHKGPHVFAFDGRAKPLEEARREYSMVGYRSDQVIRTPHVVDIFNDPRLIDLVEEYLGCVPTLYSLNGWWSFPANQPELVYSQYFHRDIDDWRFLTLFLYLSDVDETTGPHQVIAGSHTMEGMNALLAKAAAAGRDPGEFNAAASFAESMGEKFSGECERLFSDEVFNATGPAGTMYLVNTTALHRGLMPVASSRLVLWARYGLGPTINSSDLEHGPLSKRLVPTTLSASPRNRYVNRLLFDFDLAPEY